MPLSNMEVSRYGQRYIRYLALNRHPLYIIQLIDRPLPRYGYTHIQLHAASYFCGFQSGGQYLHGHPGSYVQWLHWQHRSELICVCALVVCQECKYLMLHQPIGRYSICSQLVEVVGCPRCAGVESERKMITRGSGMP